jgi:hypothetical protein
MRHRLRGIGAAILSAVALSACSRSTGSAACGIQSLTAPLAVKQAFGVGNALEAVPAAAPSSLPIRLVAGPAWHGTVASDSAGGWRVSTAATVSKDAEIGYGVLVIDDQNRSLGVLAFNGRAVPGAMHIGELVIADTVVPLLGVRLDASELRDPTCPIFPDSLR